MKILIVIWIASFVLMAINFIFGWNNLLKELKGDKWAMLKGVLLNTTNSLSGTKYKKAVVRLYIYFISVVVLFIISPFLIPIILYPIVKKLLK